MFKEIKEKVQKQFVLMEKAGPLFRVDTNRDEIWRVYLDAFSFEYRQGNSCNCCKSFLRQFGDVVGIDNGQLVSIWDFEVDDPEYSNPIKAVRDYIKSLPICDVFLSDLAKVGTDKSPDSKRNLVWEHFFVRVPAGRVMDAKNIPTKLGSARDNKNVLQRSLNEITAEAASTVLELIGQNSLYRGAEFANLVDGFSKIKRKYDKIRNNKQKELFCWLESVNASQALCRINNSAIGTLLHDLSSGVELDNAVASFERVVAPANYKRPTSLVTPKMIDAAKKRLIELGLDGMLNRRLMATTDLNVSNSLFVHRSSAQGLDAFEVLKKDVLVNPKNLSKVEEISISDFVSKVIPTAKNIRVLVENSHFGNFMSLVGPKEQGQKTPFKWGNDVSWSFSGEVAASIKEKVKAAGGKIDGYLRVSLSWSNFDDLDLHVIDPKGYRTYFANKRHAGPSGATLDVDMNAGVGTTKTPVENIYWLNKPSIEGEYKVIVNQYNHRESSDTGFEVELECEGEFSSFSSPQNGATGKNHEILTFRYSKKNGVEIIGGGQKSYSSKEKWRIKTGQFHKVNAICLSPNYWGANIGHKQYFFFLDKCETDQKIRPFYNEFLHEDLSKDRKVFELLAGKIEVESVPNELSGIGFSETERNHIFVEVEGNFKRTLKVNF